MTVRLLSEYEVAVANVFRAQPWLWYSLGETWERAQRYHPTPRRTTRHHLERFVTFDILEVTEDPGPYRGRYYRWLGTGAEMLETAAQAEGLDLVPLGARPERCPYGHRFEYEFADGAPACMVCASSEETEMAPWAAHGHFRPLIS